MLSRLFKFLKLTKDEERAIMKERRTKARRERRKRHTKVEKQSVEINSNKRKKIPFIE